MSSTPFPFLESSNLSDLSLALQSTIDSIYSSSHFNLYKNHWFTLQQLWSNLYPNSPIQFTLSSTEFQISEAFVPQSFDTGNTLFSSSLFFILQRDLLTFQRKTLKDTYGILGLSLIDPSNSSVFITEGVSDYFTAKLLLPNSNVLAFTTLGGSSLSKTLVLSLFNSITLIQDNDSTGRSNSTNLSTFFKSYNKSVYIFSPPVYKDLSESFIQSLKFSLIH